MCPAAESDSSLLHARMIGGLIVGAATTSCAAPGLRVVDASIFPEIPGTFIAMPTFMISEKAADVILEANE